MNLETADRLDGGGTARHTERGLARAFTGDYAGAHWLSSFVCSPEAERGRDRPLVAQAEPPTGRHHDF